MRRTTGLDVQVTLPLKAAQEAIAFLGCKCMLKAHVKFFIHQDFQVLLLRAAPNLFSSKLILILGTLYPDTLPFFANVSSTGKMLPILSMKGMPASNHRAINGTKGWCGFYSPSRVICVIDCSCQMTQTQHPRQSIRAMASLVILCLLLGLSHCGSTLCLVFLTASWSLRICRVGMEPSV